MRGIVSAEEPRPAVSSVSPLLSPGYIADPYPALARLRREDPVHWVEELGFWAVTRFDDVRRLFADAEIVTSDKRQGRAYAPEPRGSFSRWLDEHGVLSRDGAEHARLRRLASHAFTPRAVARMESQIRDVVRQVAEPLRGRRGVVDLMETFTNPIPNLVISRMTGVPPAGDDEVRFAELARTFVQGLFPFARDEIRRRSDAAGRELAEWVAKLAEDRRQQPRDDLLSDFATATEGEDRLSLDEIVAWVTTLIGAGSETTAMGGTNALEMVLARPPLLARLRAEPRLVPNLVSEVLRLNLAGGGGMPRYARRDFTLRGRRIRRGDSLLLCIGAANRDPEVFDDPDRLDLDRGVSQSVVFGSGAHYCIGANLARAEIGYMVEAALDFLPPGARVREDLLRYVELGFARRLEVLPVDFGAGRG